MDKKTKAKVFEATIVARENYYAKVVEAQDDESKGEDLGYYEGYSDALFDLLHTLDIGVEYEEWLFYNKRH